MQKELQQAFEMANYGNSVKAAEQILNKLRSYPEYPMLLLSHLNESPTFNGKLMAAIELKTWCDAYKNMEQFERQQYQHIIEDLKTNILFAFLSFTEKIQKTLLPAIVSLSVIEYPDRWSGLVNGLVNYSVQNEDSLLKILELMSQITNKYSYLTRSDPLYNQINITCDAFHNFLLTATRNSINNIFQNQQSTIPLQVLEQQMIIFYNLNYQDLHPLFQDNLPEWMNIINRVMKLPDTNQYFFKCKGAALQSILLYASKYKEDVQESIKGFSEQIWSLCANALPDPEYDDIVFSALKYFRSLIMWKDMKGFFASNINNLISNLILPNLAFTKSYKQLFNEEIETFIGYYFRNTELNSRRSAALELLQALVRSYPQFQDFLRSQLQGFSPSQENSEGLCLLLTLVIESAPKGFRDIDGATLLHINEQIVKYCYDTFIKNILGKMFTKNMENPEKSLQSKMSIVEILTTLRYIFYFRIYLPPNDLILIVKLCCTISTNNDSLKEILFLMVNAMLSLRHGNFLMYKDFVYYFNDQNIRQVGSDILKFISARNDEDSVLNVAATRLFHSTMKTMKSSVVQFYEFQISPLLISMLQKTDQFDFSCVLNLFQAIGFVSYWLCKSKSNFARSLQTTIQQYFHKIIQKQSDMINFCFQILSIFLQLSPGDIGFYTNVYESIIRIENWNEENQSIMSSYIQYISAYATINQNKIVDDKPIYETILGKLIELDNFDLFCRFVKRTLKICGIQNFFHAGYMEILVKGTDFICQKSLEGRKTGLLFIFDIANEYSTETVIKCLNAVRNGFFQQLLFSNQDIIQTIQTFKFRKLMYNAICNALASGCLSNVENQVIMFNLLVENCTGRFRRQNLGLGNQSAVNKKEATYQKLTVFKQIQSLEPPINIDEEVLLVQAFQRCNQRNPSIENMITDKTKDKIRKLWEKNKNN